MLFVPAPAWLGLINNIIKHGPGLAEVRELARGDGCEILSGSDVW